MKDYKTRMAYIRAKADDLSEKRRTLQKITLSCGLACVALTVLLMVLFVPYDTTPPSVSHYQKHPYYAVIEKLNVVTYKKPEFYNNYDALRELMLNIFDPYRGGIGGDPSDDNNGSAGFTRPESIGDSYVEVTDNQVSGVVEADIFKRTEQRLYYLNSSTLYVYSIAQQNSQELGRVDLKEAILQDSEQLENARWNRVKEMFLSPDGKTVTVFMNYTVSMVGDMTVIANLDVSDPENIHVTSRYMVSGSYSSARMVDGKLLVCTNCSFSSSTVNFDNTVTYVPRYGWIDSMQEFSPEDIVVPDTATSGRYRIYCLLDADTLQQKSVKALLSYPNAMFVSGDTVYSTYFYAKQNGNKAPDYLSDITAISFADGQLKVLGTVTVEGQVLNQYSMDEFEGSFRVVTSTYRANRRVLSNSAIRYDRQTDSANLYCFDKATWELKGKVEGFAPQGEEITSVRFDGYMAYVCTVERDLFTGSMGGDPVFFFDLSDPANITWTDTGVIDGYSSSLVDFGDGLLLGIGFNEERWLKIEVYAQGSGMVESLCSYERECSYSQEYKSYYIDRENQIIGMCIYDRQQRENMYLLLSCENGKMNELAHIPLTESVHMDYIRADWIDGWMYILSDNGLTTVEIDLNS